MRRLIFLFTFAIGAAVAAGQVAPVRVKEKPKPLVFETAAELREFLRWKEGVEPLVSAHRGGPVGNLPENTLEAFNYSLSVDPRVIIECDVQLSRDSLLVMTHDDNLTRTAGVAKPVTALTADELIALPLLDLLGRPSPYHIPTLGDVLAWAKGRTLLTVDVKRGVPHAKVLAQIQAVKAQNRAVVIVYNLADALWYHRHDPEIILSVPVRNDDELEALKASGVDLKRVVAFVGTREPSRKVYQGLHALGIRCILGILGNLEKKAMSKIGMEGQKIIKGYVADGADILATNEVEYTRTALNWRGR